uniref:Uncharacterized protein n=1 Tax=Caenorhabditis japonica TaxID=281687 RepID=A0A8R1I4N0_CAEJA
MNQLTISVLLLVSLIGATWSAAVVTNKQVIDTSVTEIETTLDDADFASDLSQRYELHTMGKSDFIEGYGAPMFRRSRREKLRNIGAS